MRPNRDVAHANGRAMRGSSKMKTGWDTKVDG